VGGKNRGAQQREEKTERYAQIVEKQNELANTVPRHKLNKEIAKATGLPTEYVRKARKEINSG
jgi:FixJ family two-component response regulator